MTDVSNFGVVLKEGTGGPPLVYATVGSITNIDIPELISESIEVTNHAGTWREHISSDLSSLGEFTITIGYLATETFTDYMLASSVKHWQILFPNTVTWTFDGLITKVKPSDSEASSPEQLCLDVTFVPTGECVIA